VRIGHGALRVGRGRIHTLDSDKAGSPVQPPTQKNFTAPSVPFDYERRLTKGLAMMTDQGPDEWIRRAAVLYRRGVFGPAELWNLVTVRLTPDDAPVILAGLPDDARLTLRQAYAERPWSLRPEAHDNEVRQAVERWCVSDR